jgi:AcrR family transcriptional regulator
MAPISADRWTNGSVTPMAAPGTESAATVVRRAPFSDNPRVGARGQRTQQRILDAALRVFAEVGYHRASVDRIARLGGCSRVSFYQYFASKEDVFRQLAGQLTRQVTASIEAMDAITPDAAGWSAVQTWMGRYADIHARYEPVFHAFEADEVLASLAGGTGGDVVGQIHARVTTTGIPPRQLDSLIRLVLECINHTLGVGGTLRWAAPDAYPPERIERSLADVVHRALFGRRDGVNVHGPDGGSPPVLDFVPSMVEAFQRAAPASTAKANPVYLALLTSARDVFMHHGYLNTRVDDLVTAAGVSHGAFYRYFKNKGELARILDAGAMLAIGQVVADIPDLATLDEANGRGALRRWLRRYNAAHANEAAMLRVWVDASLQDPELRAASAAPLDWGRRRMARYLAPRGFGDADTDAVVMVALLGVFGAQPRSTPGIESAARIVEQGLLGR